MGFIVTAASRIKFCWILASYTNFELIYIFLQRSEFICGLGILYGPYFFVEPISADGGLYQRDINVVP